MKTIEREKKARILPFKKNEPFEADQNVSEVTRDLFSETWRSYLDQISMAAVKLDPEMELQEEKSKPKRVKLKVL